MTITDTTSFKNKGLNFTDRKTIKERLFCLKKVFQFHQILVLANNNAYKPDFKLDIYSRKKNLSAIKNILELSNYFKEL